MCVSKLMEAGKAHYFHEIYLTEPHSGTYPSTKLLGGGGGREWLVNRI